ncbi:hypothetical protein [Ruegeria atlantica]|nr:hypothetical protein [Ruegeria atlantica]
MNRNYLIIAVAVLALVLVFSMMRSGGEDGAGEETAPAADTETEPAATE